MKAAPRSAALLILVAIGCARSPSSASSRPANSTQPPASAQPPASGSALGRAGPDASRAAEAGGRTQIPIQGGGARAVRGEHGLVTSVESHATHAGVRILEQGGNAVDAAVAVGYALAVTHPSAGNVGGGGFMLVRPAGGKTVAIDFRETAPAALTRAKFDAMIKAGGIGPAAVGVPGSVAGLNLAHSRFGKMPLAKVMAPAIELARRGHRIGTREGLTLVWNWRLLKQDRAARAIFGKGGQPRKPGTKILRRDLATTLERIAKHGNAGFYEGPTAQGLVRGLGRGGLLTLADLLGYRAAVRKPLGFRYRGLDVEVMPPPSGGGVAIAQTLMMLEQLGAHAHEAGSAEELHLFIEASRRAHAERRFGVVDPDSLSEKQRALRRTRWTDPTQLLQRGPQIDPSRATPSSEVHPLYPKAMQELEHTTHFAVIDREGNVVSCSTTLSAGFGAKLVAAGTGVVLNNSMAAFGTAGENLPAPGRRTTSSMAPTLVLRDGKVVLVLGSPGGDTISSSIAQVLRNVVDHAMTIDQAVDAPRIHHGFVPDELRYEKQRPVPAAVLSALQKLGHRVSRKRIPIGDANSILIAEGVAWGYADPREGGLALACQPGLHSKPGSTY